MRGSGKETAVVSASADVSGQAPAEVDSPTDGGADNSPSGGNPWELPSGDSPIPDGGDVGLGVVLALLLVGGVLLTSGGPSLGR
jgi:hypothetical protein